MFRNTDDMKSITDDIKASLDRLIFLFEHPPEGDPPEFSAKR